MTSIRRLIAIASFCVLFFLTYPVQAETYHHESPDWFKTLQKAGETEKEYASTSNNYRDIRSAFSEVFDKDLMMDFFVEHLSIAKQGYQITATDFSPYMIPNYTMDNFKIIKQTEKEMIISDQNRPFHSLASPYKMIRYFTFEMKDKKWIITNIDWTVEKMIVKEKIVE